MANQKHYCYGSGMFGCLYDYGPKFCADKEDAISDLMLLFPLFPLEDGEPVRMRANLEADGRHVFENPCEAGAQYCELSEHEGECPEDCEG